MIPYLDYLNTDSSRTIGRLPLILAMVLLIPIGLVAFVINSGIQSIRSRQRILLHERGLAGIQPGNYRVPLIADMRGVVEDVYENLNSAQSNEYLPDDSDEEAASGSTYVAAERSPPPNGDANPLDKSEKAQVPTLALAPYQFRMINALDSVGWRKYPVYIHKVRHSHAAIIVRTDKPSFDEGRLILRHWLDEEFIP